MKKTVSVFLALVMCVFCMSGIASAENTEVSFNPGTYEGRANSTGGEIVVEVTVSEHAIESIDVVTCNDTDGVKNVPLERIPAQILEHQSLNVDAVSGATLTSLFLKNAITDAVKQATDSTDGLMEKVSYQAPAQTDMEADVVVVGGGSAGLTAAAQAGSLGLNVVLIERNGFLGGTSLVSDAGVMESSVDYLSADRSAFETLVDEAGIEYSLLSGEYLGNTLGWMSFVPAEGRSQMATGIAALEAFAVEKGVTILKDTSVTGLVIDDGKVTGVQAEPIGQESFTVSSKAVILATGGFARNKDLIAEYMPDYAEVIPCNLSGSRGEAIGWVSELNAKLYNMDSNLQWYPASEALMAHSFGASAGFYVDPEGLAINETNAYSDTARDAFLKFGQQTTYYQLITSEVAAAAGTTKNVEDCLRAGRGFEYASVSEAAEAYGLTNLVETMAGFGVAENSAVYVCPVRPCMYSTYGGIEIDSLGHVLNTDDEAIPGLYAVGEVTGSADYKALGIYLGQIGQGMQQSVIAARTVADEIM